MLADKQLAGSQYLVANGRYLPKSLMTLMTNDIMTTFEGTEREGKALVVAPTTLRQSTEGATDWRIGHQPYLLGLILYGSAVSAI